jgi:hypothetical protein
MSAEEIESILLDAGLEAQDVNNLLEEYRVVQDDFRDGAYSEVGKSTGRFCEGVVRILRYDMDSEYHSSDPVRQFATELFDRRDEGEYSTAIYQHLSNMLHTAWDIRSNRDAAHMNVETAVNKADAKLSVALCSSMLVELIREFATEEADVDTDRITNAIEDLSVTVEQNPLRGLVTSKYEFDSAAVADTLDGLISIVEGDGEVEPGPEFHDLRVRQQAVALALGRLAAHDLGFIEANQISKRATWFQDRIESDKVGTYLDEKAYIEEEHGQYYLPGYQVENAIADLE